MNACEETSIFIVIVNSTGECFYSARAREKNMENMNSFIKNFKSECMTNGDRREEQGGVRYVKGVERKMR